MAQSRFRAARILLNGKKIAEVSNSTYTHRGNDANQFGLEGVLGQSEGIDETELDIDTVTPVKGHADNVKRMLVDKLDVQIQIAVDGGLETIDGRIIERGYTSDSKTGECKGKFKFVGGAPRLADVS